MKIIAHTPAEAVGGVLAWFYFDQQSKSGKQDSH